MHSKDWVWHKLWPIVSMHLHNIFRNKVSLVNFIKLPAVDLSIILFGPAPKAPPPATDSAQLPV